MKKPNQILKMLFIRHWNFTLFLSPFDFWGCLNVIINGELWIMNLVVVKMGSIFKKQWKNFPSASAEARSKGILFYLLIGLFWLVFLAAWCLHVNRKIKLECYYNYCFEKARYQADGKPMTWGFVANKKEYSYWHYWDCGYRKLL